MKKKVILALILCFVLSVTTVMAQEQQQNFHLKNMIKLKLDLANKIIPFFLELNLTEAQKEKIHNRIHQTLENNKDEIINLLTLIDEHCQIMEAEVFDEGKFRASFQEIAAAAEEMAVIKAKTIFSLKGELSSQQLAKTIQLRKDIFLIIKNHIINMF